MTSSKPIQPADRISSVREYYFSRKLKEVALMNEDSSLPRVISLGIGGPDFMPDNTTIEALCQDAQQPDAHSYQSYIGLPELRQAWSRFYQRWYDVSLRPDTEILPLLGSKEGIMHISMAMLNPGDKVLVPDPGYPTYTSVSRLVGAEVIPYNLTAEHQWEPDWQELETLPDIDDVRIMWVNYPHMPTGHNASRQLLEKIVDFGRRHGILIVHDNPYSFILNNEPLSILSIPGAKEQCLELNSMSKSHSMAGWRQGVVCGQPEFIQWILRVKSNVDSGMFRPMMKAAIRALDAPDTYYHDLNARYNERRRAAERIMSRLGCQWDNQQQGLFLWGRIPDSCPDAESLTEQVLHRARVFITPGFIFGQNGQRYIRISLCAPVEQMNEALHRIEQIM